MTTITKPSPNSKATLSAFVAGKPLPKSKGTKGGKGNDKGGGKKTPGKKGGKGDGKSFKKNSQKKATPGSGSGKKQKKISGGRGVGKLKIKGNIKKKGR